MLLLLVAGWSFAEAILFFIVADVPISWIAVRWGWRRAALAAVTGALAAAAGGGILYLWAAADPVGAKAAIAGIPGIDHRIVGETARSFAENGYWAMLAGSLTGVPYKLYVVAAAGEGSPLLPLLLLTPLVRVPRFLAAAFAAAAISELLSPWMGMRARLLLLAGFWLLFYAIYFAVMPD